MLQTLLTKKDRKPRITEKKFTIEKMNSELQSLQSFKNIIKTAI